MISSVNIECPFPFYDSRDKQQFRQKECAGEIVTGILSRKGHVHPFQIFKQTTPATKLSFKIFDINDIEILSLGANAFSVTQTDDGYFIHSKLTGQTHTDLICPNRYYYEIKTSNFTFYSEVFEVIDY